MSQIRSRSPFRGSPSSTASRIWSLGGIALRLNLTIETLEDLQLALGAVLDHLEPGDERLGGEVTVAVSLEDGGLETGCRPLDLLDELSADGGDIDLRRVLWAVDRRRRTSTGERCG